MRVCNTCEVQKPLEDFMRPNMRRRSRSCQACLDDRFDAREQANQFLTFKNMVQRARAQANIAKEPDAMSEEVIRALHGQPCPLCGQQASFVRRIAYEGAFCDDNIEALCHICFKWTLLNHGYRRNEDVVHHARRIVNFNRTQ